MPSSGDSAKEEEEQVAPGSQRKDKEAVAGNTGATGQTGGALGGTEEGESKNGGAGGDGNAMSGSESAEVAAGKVSLEQYLNYEN